MKDKNSKKTRLFLYFIIAFLSFYLIFIVIKIVGPIGDWGGLIGGMFAGIATLIAFLVTVKANDKQFEFLIMKDKPILSIAIISIVPRLFPNKDETTLKINSFLHNWKIEQNREKDFVELMCTIKNNGISTAEGIKIRAKEKGIYKIFNPDKIDRYNKKNKFIKKVKAEWFPICDDLPNGKSVDVSIYIHVDKRETSSFQIEVSGDYINIPLISKLKNINYSYKIGWNVQQ